MKRQNYNPSNILIIPLNVGYKMIFRLNPRLKTSIQKNLVFPLSRIKEINKIRLNNIESTFWANTGTLFGIILTYLSFVIACVFGFAQFGDQTDLSALDSTLPLSIIIISLIVFTIVTLPLVIRNILYHLPPNLYSNVSLSNLNQSEILTFASMKMWELCDNFEMSFKKENTQKLIELNNLALKEMSKKINQDNYNTFFQANSPVLIPEIINLNRNINKFIKSYYKFHYNAIEIRDLTAQKLKIRERELSHHILQFSPVIFNSRINTLALSLDTLNYIIQNKNFDPEIHEVFRNHLKEIFRIRKDIVEKAKLHLEQLVIFSDTHKYIIGMASITSTSRSLKIFLRGLSSSIEKSTNRFEIFSKSIFLSERIEKVFSNKDKFIEKCWNQIIGEFKTILHRSKAHYGMDLLVSVENLYKQKQNKFVGGKMNIPELLYAIKYPNGINGQSPSNKFSSIKTSELVINQAFNLIDLRSDLMKYYSEDISLIKNNFQIELNRLLSKNGKKYICIFGYSRIVRNVLKSFAEEIKRKEVLLFVFKEEKDEMIDTRVLRYELNDDSPLYNIRNTFTASDNFLYSLLTKKDNVVLLAGAEAYCPSSKLLFHTNSYQDRIERFLKKITENELIKPLPEIWILANDYKLYKKFPSPDGFFKNEVISDHFDEVDLYDFSNYNGNVVWISNIKTEGNIR